MDVFDGRFRNGHETPRRETPGKHASGFSGRSWEDHHLSVYVSHPMSACDARIARASQTSPNHCGDLQRVRGPSVTPPWFQRSWQDTSVPDQNQRTVSSTARRSSSFLTALISLPGCGPGRCCARKVPEERCAEET